MGICDLIRQHVSPRLRRAVCLAAVGWLMLAAPVAAQVLISPVLVELAPRQRAVTVSVTLSSAATAPMRLQADVLQWRQDLGGAPVTAPSDDLLVAPPIVDLQPGTTQIFRVALRGARSSQDELAYRLILEDTQDQNLAAANAGGAMVKFRMRYDLPVLIAPVVAAPTLLRWKSCAADVDTPANNAAQAKGPIPIKSEVCARVINAGRQRVKLQSVTLSGDGWQQSLSLKDGENLLAGTEREWRFPLPAGQMGVATGLMAQTATGETLQAQRGGF